MLLMGYTEISASNSSKIKSVQNKCMNCTFRRPQIEINCMAQSEKQNLNYSLSKCDPASAHGFLNLTLQHSCKWGAIHNSCKVKVT